MPETAETPKRYDENEDKCPECGGDLNFGNLDIDGWILEQSSSCVDCENSFLDIYMFARRELIEPKE